MSLQAQAIAEIRQERRISKDEMSDADVARLTVTQWKHFALAVEAISTSYGRLLRGRR